MSARRRFGRSWSIELDPRARVPRYRQIYARVRAGIADGTLRPSQRLPSARALASQLAVARGTVDAAYALLADEGFIETRGAAGTVVAPALARLRPARTPLRSQSAQTVRARQALRAGGEWTLRPFQLGLPALDAFPLRVWARLAGRCARQWPRSAMIHQSSFGYPPLREAIAAYLAVARGIACTSEQVVITGGFQATMGLVTRALLRDADPVWVEDPGYFYARNALTAAGARAIPIPVDAQGIDVAAGCARAPQARLAVVTPSHQAPLGMTLDLGRRLALLAWANEAEAWILEDDYDGEFRYQSRPVPALKSLDAAGRVLYAGTFSKVLFPGLRLGYLILPDGLIEVFERLLALFYMDSPRFLPAVVTEFMTEGHFARHIRRMRQLYAERRAALAEALAGTLRGRLRVELQAGGMHLIGWLADDMRDVSVAQRAYARGLAVSALSSWRIEPRAEHALLLSFTNIPAHAARSASQRLARAFA